MRLGAAGVEGHIDLKAPSSNEGEEFQHTEGSWESILTCGNSAWHEDRRVGWIQSVAERVLPSLPALTGQWGCWWGQVRKSTTHMLLRGASEMAQDN